jgi:hypothetical protein
MLSIKTERRSAQRQPAWTNADSIRAEGSPLNRHVVSTRDQSIRMFRHDWLERLSHVHPIVPHVLYLPVVTGVLYLAPTRAARNALLFLGGLVMWTVVEYVLHRFVFHAPEDVMDETHRIIAELTPGEPAIPALPGWRHVAYFITHGVHHEYPSDSSRLVLPPAVSVPAAAAFYLAFRLLLGAPDALPAFAGFVVGYLIYDTVHYAVHHRQLPTALGRYTKRRHYRHHFVDPDRDYGVSSPVWDVVFGTFTPRSRARHSTPVRL